MISRGTCTDGNAAILPVKVRGARSLFLIIAHISFLSNCFGGWLSKMLGSKKAEEINSRRFHAHIEVKNSASSVRGLKGGV